jgi:uncharacterized protein YgiM (DUF1202 family)
MIRFYLLLAVSVIGLGNGLHAEDIAYVSSKQTKIYREASLKSDLMTVLQQNEKVLVLDQQGVWWQIKYTEVSGWLSRYSVSSAKPPEEKNSVFSRLQNFFSSDSKRARVTLVSTAGSVRGLTEEQSDALGKTDFEAVSRMEAFLVSEAEVDEFVTSAIE